MPESAGPFGEPRDLTGPAKIVVTRSGNPLRCEFAMTPCTSAGGFSPGLVACIDQLFDLDGTCGTSTAQLGKTFRHFTVLPRPNAYADVCSLDQNDPLAGRCSGDAGELLFTTDVDGNVLVPWDYRDVLLRVGGVPVPRIGRGRAVFDPFASDVVVESLFLPKDGFFSSYAPEGLRLPPIFTPIADTSSAATLFGTIDAARGVMRLARRSPIFGECVDPTSAPHPRGIPCFQTQTGSALVDDCPSGFHCGDAVCYAGRTPTATPCDEDPDCGAGEECGPSLCELRDRHAQGGIGPVVLSRATPSGDAAGSFDAVELREAVPLDGLNESQEIFAFVLNEEISGQAQTGLDQNNDGDALDFRVRAFRLGSSTELLSAANLVANPQPRIDGWALALSDELLFFTANEMHAMPVIPERITNAAPSDTLRDVSVSGDGQHVAYQGNDDGIYVWSRATGATVQVDLDPSGVPLLGQAAHTSISEDGRFVAFSNSPDSFPGLGPGSGGAIFVHDRDGDGDGIYDETGANERKTVWVSRTSTGAVPTPLVCGPDTVGASFPVLSPNGRFVLFLSSHVDLVPGDGNAGCGPGVETPETRRGADYFVHDRDADGNGVLDDPGPEGTSIARVSLRADETEAPDGVGIVFFESRNRAISDNGRYVAFLAQTPFDAFDTNGTQDVYLRDRNLDGDGVFDEPGSSATIWASRHADASPVRLTDLSSDGRFVVFDSASPQLSSQDFNLVEDVFLFDRTTGQFILVSGPVNGVAPQAPSRSGAILANGRAVRFESFATSFAPDDDPGTVDAFSQDLLDYFGGAVPNGDPVRFPASAVSIPATRPVRASGATGIDEAVITADASGDPTDGNGTEDVYVARVPAGTPGLDLNGDGDATDWLVRVVDLHPTPPTVTNLPGIAPVSVSGGAAAFLRTEREISSGLPGEPNHDGDLNGDGDVVDAVVQLWAGRGNATAQSLGLGATDVKLTGDLVAAIANEGAQSEDLNGDGDFVDGTLAVWQRPPPGSPGAPGGPWELPPFAVDAIQAKGKLVAYRVPEGAQNADLTEDGDKSDRVIGLYRLGVGVVPIADGSGRSQPAEDFVLGPPDATSQLSLLAFRTREAALCGTSGCNLVPADQGGCILNADGDCDDDVLQVFDPGAPLSPLRSSGTSVVPCGFEACDPSVPYRVSASSVRFLTRETDEGRDLNGDGDATDLLVQIFSVRDNLVKVIAQVVEPPASQQGESTSIDPVEPPPLDTPDRDSQVLLTQGVCVESLATSCTTSADCAAGAFCEAADSTCKREGAPCRAGIPADCAPVETCMPGFVVASSPDGDGDGIVDAVDNCPASFNSGQIDTDRDGLGEDEPNATGCDDAVCGNSIVETGEACDDGNLANTDGCNQFCRLGGCFGDVDLDGNIDSNDAGLFFSVSGCFVCANGCNPVCDSNRDGLVNASDALALHLSLGTSRPAPPSSGGCGLLGAELVPILARLAARRRRR